MESVYLETTFISYLVALPSRDLIVAAHQQVSRQWWEERANSFRCCVSQVVIDEISAGDSNEIQKRQAIVEGLDVLEMSTDAETLTTSLIHTDIFPPRAVRDAAHIAVATVHGVEYLLTWNCKHLANAQLADRLSKVCEQEGYRLPHICTPEELLESPIDD